MPRLLSTPTTATTSSSGGTSTTADNHGHVAVHSANASEPASDYIAEHEMEPPKQVEQGGEGRSGAKAAHQHGPQRPRIVKRHLKARMSDKGEHTHNHEMLGAGLGDR